MHINKFTSGYSPSFMQPAQEVMGEMKECFILTREKFRPSDVTLFFSFHTALRRLERAVFHSFLASFLIGKVIFVIKLDVLFSNFNYINVFL